MHSRRKFLIGAIAAAVLLFVVLNMTFHSTDPSAAFEDKENVSIAVTGDVMFARKMPNVLSLESSPFEGVSDVTSNVDLLLINFENAATTSGDALKGDVPFKCDPSYVPLAKANNNTIASIANNHALDYGITGMKDTIQNLKDAGMRAMRVMIFMGPVMNFFMYVSIIAIIWFGHGIVLEESALGGMQVGDLSAFITYATQILSSLMMSQTVWLDIFLVTMEICHGALGQT